MKFKPVDETSLRHLFCSSFAEELLHLSYLGPVLNSAGSIETSPDCMILDRRKHPFKPLRCEFKFTPSGAQDFAHNGHFDIAIVWSLAQGLSKDQLLGELLKQNGCAEIIVVADMKAFYDLPVYTMGALSALGGMDIVRDIAIKRNLPAVFALCIAARLYPSKFDFGRMKDLLCARFPEVQKMLPQGRGNAVSVFLQTKPPLLELMHGQSYRWTSKIDSINGAAELSQLLTNNFLAEGPSDEDLNTVRA